MLTEPSPDRLGLWARHRDDMRLANQSRATITGRQGVLRNLAGPVDLADIGPGNIRAFIGREGLRPISRQSYLAHIRTFYRWAVFHDLLEHDPTVKIVGPTVQRGLPRPISHADLRRAVATAPPLVRAWLLLGALAGLRCAEAASLHADDIRPPVLIITGKGDKTRAIPIHPDLMGELANWPTEGYLFPGRVNGHVTPQWVSEAVGSHLRSLGIRSSAHKARARFATDLYRVQQDIVSTQHALGHAKIETTMAYVEADQPKLEAMVAAIDYGLRT